MAKKPNRRLIVLVASLALLCLLVLLRPSSTPQINSFGDCRNAGHAVRESYPEVCTTPDGRSFSNPSQLPLNE